VRIGTGQGFQTIAGPTEAAAGAQIMVGPEGAALIAYSQTCVVRAPAAAITIVEDHAPCASMPKPSYFGFAQSNEVGVAITSDAFGFTPKVDAPDTSEAPEKSQAPQSQAPQSQAPPKSQAPQESRAPAPVPETTQPNTAQGDERPSDHSGLLIVGGVVVGAGVLAALLASQGGDHPASP
jgi:hypothetical protein